jgi:hypothetical protein
MTSHLPWYAPLLVATAAACGGHTDLGSNEDIAAKWQQYCEKEAARSTSCGSTSKSTCAEDATCMQGLLRPGVVDTLTACLLARACGANDDACFGMTAAPYQSDPAASTYTSSCASKYAACKQAGVSFSDDVCGNAGLFRADVLGRLQACIDGDCSQVRSCTEAVATAQGCK